VLGARVPKGTLPDGLWWDTSDPYDYLRVDPHADHDYVIFGGADVKTGQEDDANQVFQRLEERLHRLLPMATMQHRWLGQVVETDDGLPFIGENAHQEFIATGFCGNGFTLGTLSAMMGVSHLLHTRRPSQLRAFLYKLGDVEGEVLDRLINLHVVLPGCSRSDAVVVFLQPSQQPHP
jgi:glycine/D-amino acid oxidase-like deaminating enzyme